MYYACSHWTSTDYNKYLDVCTFLNYVCEPRELKKKKDKIVQFASLYFELDYLWFIEDAVSCVLFKRFIISNNKCQACFKNVAKHFWTFFVSFPELSQAQRSFSRNLQGFTFECIGGTQTDDERVISRSLSEFGKLISSIEDERDRMVSIVFLFIRSANPANDPAAHWYIACYQNTNAVPPPSFIVLILKLFSMHSRETTRNVSGWLISCSITCSFFHFSCNQGSKRT